MLSDKDFTRKGSFDSKPDESFDEKSITTLDQKTNEQAIELPHIELDSDSQFYEQLENNVFKNLRAEPPYSVPQIDEKVRSLRVKRYLPPSKKVNIMKTLKLKELWEENKAIRIAFACPSISGSCDGNHHAYGRR